MRDTRSGNSFGSSSGRSRRLDDFQFTFGEGPCLDAVRNVRRVFVPDFADPTEQRWLRYGGAVLDAGVRAVYALPIARFTACVGALDLFRDVPGPMVGAGLTGSLLAAELAAIPLWDLMSEDRDWTAAGEGVTAGSSWLRWN